MRYFAYGSNMSHARLASRAPSASRVGIAQLAGHRLRFHKISHKDGSAKCDAEQTGQPDDRVIGVVYEIDEEDKALLDRCEGLGNGYEIKQVMVSFSSGSSVVAFIYYATHIDPSLKPFHWYKAHVVRGAKENALPGSYIGMLEKIESVDDPDAKRSARETALYHP